MVENMKKGATPTNYKPVVQQRLLQDIFKTPNQQIHDESSEEVQINTAKRKDIWKGGRRDNTTGFRKLTGICDYVYTSLTKIRPKTADTATLTTASSWPIYIISNAWDTTEDSTIILQAVYR